MSTENTSLERLKTRLDTLVAKRKAITDVAESEVRENLTEAETIEYKSLTEEIRKVDARIDELTPAETGHETAGAAAIRQGSAADERRSASAILSSVREDDSQLVYRKHARTSFVLDQMRVGTNQDPSGEARARLAKHAGQMDRVLSDSVEYRDLNRTDGTGGYFSPPLWLMNEWIAFARPGRATANVCSQQALPGGTDSINIPKILTGSATAIQTADNSPVQQTDLTDTSVQANVKTIAGQQSIALQLLEQSPVSFDQVVFQDLAADYAQRLDLQVLNGSNASGQVQGILGTTGIQTVTYSDTTQAAGTLYSAIANAIQLVHVNRFLPPSVIVMHPRRWGKMLALTDNQGRPLFLPDVDGPRNAMGTLGEVASQGVVGQIQGLPVVTDANIPTNLGAGTNQDTILVMRASDLILFEGGLRSRVLMEVKGQNLEAVLQVYNYVAFTAARFPASIVQITGAGLSTPSF